MVPLCFDSLMGLTWSVLSEKGLQGTELFHVAARAKVDEAFCPFLLHKLSRGVSTVCVA
jgi:hypothetical protein